MANELALFEGSELAPARKPRQPRVIEAKFKVVEEDEYDRQRRKEAELQDGLRAACSFIDCIYTHDIKRMIVAGEYESAIAQLEQIEFKVAKAAKLIKEHKPKKR